MAGRLADVARTVAVLAVVAVAGVAGWYVLVAYPDSIAELLGIVALLLVLPAALRLGSSIADALFPVHNVAEVAVEGPITRDAGGSALRRPMGASADDLVEQIDRADEDRGAEALLLTVNTPGGEIVPSEDIRLAAERFDGPTIAYATDLCASGGYDVASGCDELWARDGTLVGSIGVIGSRVNASDLADRLGLSYEQLTAGEYKDAGVPLKDLEPDERAYLQELIDGYYDQFVATVAAGRDLSPEEIRDTEARVYLGEEAAEMGLVDELGTRRDVEDRLADRIGESVAVREFEPTTGIAGRLRGGAASVAFALGAGVASVLGGDVDGTRFRR